MDRDTNYLDEYTTPEGVTVKTIGVRGVGSAPVKQEVLVELPLPEATDDGE